MRPIIILLFMTLVLTFLTIEAGLVLMTQPDMVQASDSEQEAGAVEFEQVVEFDRDIHFLTLDGQEKVIPSGGYYVDAVQNGLRLKSADHEEAEAIIVQAEETTHGQSVESPEAMSMKEGEDQQIVVCCCRTEKQCRRLDRRAGFRHAGSNQ
jgi:hypothetical protein